MLSLRVPFVSAALAAAGVVTVALSAPASAQTFRLAVVGFGDTEGQPYRTSDGSGFFVHTAQDFGDGTPTIVRPVSAPSWEAGDDLEWTSYVSHDTLGPSRRAGGVNNQSDQFYLSRGVYAPGFTDYSAKLVSLTSGYAAPGATAVRNAVVQSGVMFGASFFQGPATPFGASPNPIAQEGIFLARLTVRRGVTISGDLSVYVGRVGVVGSLNFPSVVLDGGPPIPIPGTFGYEFHLQSYLVAQPNITDDGFDADGNPFGAADVYDVWLNALPFPAPGPVAVFALAGMAGLRRRRVAIHH